MRRRVTAGLLVCLLSGWTTMSVAAVRDGSGASAGSILQNSGVTGGLCVLVEQSAETGIELKGKGPYLIHCLYSKPEDVAAARKTLQDRDAIGPVTADRLRGGRLPLGNNLVNLLVAPDAKIAENEILRVLRPGGVALLGGKKTVKPWPAEIDEWTHWLHGADGNAVAKDRIVGPPKHLQWVAGPVWQRHHEIVQSISSAVSAGGRLFYICDEAPPSVAGVHGQWALIACDAFNGVLLWKRPIEDWGWKAWTQKQTAGRWNHPLHIARRLVAVKDRVYATLGFNAPLVALDAVTGRTVRTYNGTEFTDEIAWRDGLLVLVVNKAAQKPGRLKQNPPEKKQVMAIRADTGKMLWRTGDFTGIASSGKTPNVGRITHLGLVVGDKAVFFIEEDAVVALDLKNGSELWRAPRPPKKPEMGHVKYFPPNLCSLVVYKDVVLFAQPEGPYTRKTWNRSVPVSLTALSAKTGSVMWSRPCGKWGPGAQPDVFVIDGLVWTHHGKTRSMIALDLVTGEEKKQVSTEKAFNEVHHHRCYRNKATERFVVTSRRGVEFIDLASGENTEHDWVRGTCRLGYMPCNGLLYSPPHPCACYIQIKLNGYYAFAPEQTLLLASSKESSRLEKGLAYMARIGSSRPESPDRSRHEREPDGHGARQAVPPRGVARLPAPGTREVTSTWPTYRADIRRSGSTAAEVPAGLQQLWVTPIGGKPSGCTVAGGRVFAAAIDRHRVCALDAKTGEPVWNYTAGARIDSPPTLHDGLALFGCADGWVYCLRASDGALAWRFRVAPEERRVPSFGQLESPWPAHGSVLVKDNVVYANAGRSSYLDGGLHMVALEPRTGKLIRELKPLNGNPNGLSDVLSSDGTLVLQRHLKYHLESDAGTRKLRPGRRAMTTAGMLDDSMFSRTSWTPGGKAVGKGARKNHFDLLVFDDATVYGVAYATTGGFGGWIVPGKQQYKLLAVDEGKPKPRWSRRIGVRVQAMALAGDKLLAAGPPDIMDKADPWGAFEGRKGGVLLAVSAKDGAVVAEHKLAAPPVFDGMAVGDGRVYVATMDGKVVCWGE